MDDYDRMADLNAMLQYRGFPTVTGAEIITIKRGHSDDGGFDYSNLTSDVLRIEALSRMAYDMEIVGLCQRISGYEIVRKSVTDKLGESFTVTQLYQVITETSRIRREREEMQRKGLVKCDCGHTVHKSQRMMASRGSSCPDCYDRMSN